ncbi:cobyric acid synthase [uncultured Paludibaculum sp.]|uniref:cobyric acid synthase n=1 Tax=uncultured Paludibaculum sp. TaxID=1765020 RepID=UPI002AAB54B0|nr:cobyric acid synthase [uncultured Paludibaculum sp.]
MHTPALMVLGTASHTGKSIITAGLGRIFSDEGRRVAPFKAQNMSLNSAATPEGHEIGRAQALQAEACRVTPRMEMNPVLIKPSSETGAQVVLMGRVWGQVTAADYFKHRTDALFPSVVESYQRLAAEHELILLEGAGSPAEINLRAHDIVNMRMAHAAEADCVLVGDIDRGGVFASLYGTVELLSPEDRARIRGFIINKFRGDESLLYSGVQMMEERLGIPCVGVVHFLRDLGLEEEDGVAMEDRRTAARVWAGSRDRTSADAQLRIGVVALPHMANFTDFDALGMEPSVSLAFLEQPEEAALADVLILPGTKQTVDDLHWLEARGFAAAVARHAGPLIGICGGFQMLGLSIEDPHGVESAGLARSTEGLGLLAIRTVMDRAKTVRRAVGQASGWTAATFSGYEIHMGETQYEDGSQPFSRIRREGEREEIADGAHDASGRIWGSYIHGLFDDDGFRHSFIDGARRACGLPPAASYAAVTEQRQARIDRWADHLRKSLKLDVIRGWIDGQR